MEYRFTFKHMDTSDAMQDYARKRFDTIEKFGLHKPGKIHFIFSVQRQEKQTEVLVDFGSSHFAAISKHQDMYTAIDLAVEKIERQLSKNKEKRTSHRAISLAKEWAMRALSIGRGVKDE